MTLTSAVIPAQRPRRLIRRIVPKKLSIGTAYVMRIWNGRDVSLAGLETGPARAGPVIARGGGPA